MVALRDAFHRPFKILCNTLFFLLKKTCFSQLPGTFLINSISYKSKQMLFAESTQNLWFLCHQKSEPAGARKHSIMQPGKIGFIQNRKESATIWRILNMQVYRWQATLCAYYLWLKEKLLGWEFANYQKFLTSGFGEQFIIFWQIEPAMKVKMGLHLRGHRFWNNLCLVIWNNQNYPK